MGKVGNFFKTITKPGVKLIQRLGQTKPGHRISDWKVFNWLSRHNAVRDGSGNLEYEAIPGKAPKTWVKQVAKTGKAAKNAKVAQHVTSGIGEIGTIGLIGFAVVEIIASIVAQAPIEANVQAAQADLELYKDVAALYETINNENGLIDVLNNAMLESEYAMWTNLQNINSINAVQNEDKSAVLTFNVDASFHKTGELEIHTFDVKFNLSEEEYNALIASYNPEKMYSTLALTENQAKLNSLEMFKIFDLKALKNSVELISKTIEGKDCDIVLKDCYELEINPSEEKNDFISPVVDMYYNALMESGALLTDNFNNNVKSLLEASKPVNGKAVKHGYTYEINDDGTFNVNVYTKVDIHAPLCCTLKVNPNSILFKESELPIVISNYFEGIEQDAIVELANSENKIDNFALSNNHSEYVWYVVGALAETTEGEFVEFIAETHNVTIYKDAQTGEYVVVPNNTNSNNKEENVENVTPDEKIEENLDSDTPTADKNKENLDSDTLTDKNIEDSKTPDSENSNEEDITSNVTAE